MKALIQEFLYEKKSILITLATTIFLYVVYLFTLSDSALIASGTSVIMATTLYGSIMSERKSTNFEKFLISTPLGKKSIINTGYLLGLALNILVIFVFYILHILKINFIPKEYFKSGIYLTNSLFLVSFSIGLISNAILFPFFILNDTKKKNLTSILVFMIIGLASFSVVYFIFNEKIFTLNIRILIYFVVSCIMYIISYFTTIKLYLKKDL